MDINTLSRSAAIELLSQVMYDQHTGYLLGSAAIHTVSVNPGDTMLYIDFCAVHSCNHAYTMEGTNAKWINSFRGTDNVIKWGGDELIVMLPYADTEGAINRLVSNMQYNDVYAVIVVLTCDDSLVSTAIRADRILTDVKKGLDKVSRNAEYMCGDCTVVYEGGF